MLAAVNTAYGGPSVIEVKQIPRPSVQPNEVLVRVHATTVNRTDCGFLRGRPHIVQLFSGIGRPKNTVLGNEFAGEIIEIGSAVNMFNVGDKVFGYSEPSFGAHAEYLARPESSMIAKMPKGMTYTQAAPLTEGSHYALNNIRRAGVKRGDSVLVNGATGAIGSAAVQIMKAMGAHVIAVCATKHIELVRGLGADIVIDYTREDFTKQGGPYSFIFDAVGKSSFGACKPLLTEGGIYCSTEFGKNIENPFLAMWGSVGRRSKRVIFPMPIETQQDALYFKDLAERGAFKPVIDRTYPLKDIAKAYEYVETGFKTGNVVIEVV